MKSPDEIKKSLECCAEISVCSECPYYKPNSACVENKWLDALEYIQQLENKIGELTEKVEQLEAAQPKWISVKDRLPDDGQRVVGIAENGITGIMDYKNDGTPFAARILGVYFSNITYWIPLPQPPKEDT